MTHHSAQETVRLWPDGPPSDLGVSGDEIHYAFPSGLAEGMSSVRNVSEATLTVYPPTNGVPSGVGIIVVPGGGWIINAIDHEGWQVAEWLRGLGHTVFVLKYRVQGSGPDQAVFDERQAASNATLASRPPVARLPRTIGELISTDGYLRARHAAEQDGRRALQWVHENGDGFGITPGRVGMIGFSAGAFLSVDVALGEPRVPLGFVGAIYGGETRGAPVPHDAPPLFSAVAQDDLLWKITESLHRDWSDADRPSEFHLFARGGHGFGMVKQGAPSDNWTDLFEAWLNDLAWP